MSVRQPIAFYSSNLDVTLCHHFRAGLLEDNELLFFIRI